MEAVLLASGMLLAYQYAHRRYQQGVESADDPPFNPNDQPSPSWPGRCVNEDGTIREECQQVVRENGAVHLNESRFYRHDVHRREPIPEFPPPPRPPRTVTNPAEQEMIHEFRSERPATLSMGAVGNTAYRPSWMRADDVPQLSDSASTRASSTCAPGRLNRKIPAA